METRYQPENCCLSDLLPDIYRCLNRSPPFCFLALGSCSLLKRRLADAKSDSFSPAVGRREGGHQPRGWGIGDVIALFFKYSESFGIKDFKGSQYPVMTEIRTAVVK